MKHIKLFEKFENEILISEDGMADIWRDHINWKLVDDIKDLSLEYLDNGYELVLDVEYWFKWHWTGIFKLSFSHNVNILRWYNLDKINIDYRDKFVFFTSNKIPNKIKYVFALTKGWRYYKNGGYGYYTDISSELLDRIKEFYPDENIYIYTTDNFSTGVYEED